MNKILNCQRGFLSRRIFPFLDNFSQIVRLMGWFVFRFYHNGATYFSKRRSLEACSLFLFSTCKQLHKNQKRLFRTIFQRVFSKLFHLKIEIRKFIYHYDCLSNVLNVLLVSCEQFQKTDLSRFQIKCLSSEKICFRFVVTSYFSENGQMCYRSLRYFQVKLYLANLSL